MGKINQPHNLHINIMKYLYLFDHTYMYALYPIYLFTKYIYSAITCNILSIFNEYSPLDSKVNT